MRTTTSQQFTNVGQGATLLARNGDSMRYAVTGTYTSVEWSIERSLDGGQTWQQVYAGSENATGAFGVVVPPTAAVVRYRARVDAWDEEDEGNEDITLALTHDSEDNVKFIDDTAYTVKAADEGKTLYTLSGSATTITLPRNATEALPIDFTVAIVQGGAGAVTVAVESGDSLRSLGDAVAISGQYGAASAKRVSSSEWLLVGAIA